MIPRRVMCVCIKLSKIILKFLLKSIVRLFTMSKISKLSILIIHNISVNSCYLVFVFEFFIIVFNEIIEIIGLSHHLCWNIIMIVIFTKFFIYFFTVPSYSAQFKIYLIHQFNIIGIRNGVSCRIYIY